MSKRVVAILLFGGTGERFGSPFPKQFADVGGRTLMGETLQGIAKLSFVNAIYLVSHPSFMEKTHEVALQENLEKIKAIIPGGNSREESVYEAMKYLSTTTIDPDDVVMICDGDRPYIEERIFSENVDTARAVGGAVTALPASDSIFYSRNGYYADSYLPRKQIYRAQTPQSFLFEPFWKSLSKMKKKKKLDEYTDDASLFAACRHDIGIVMGDEKNIKITTQLDLAAYLQRREEKSAKYNPESVTLLLAPSSASIPITRSSFSTKAGRGSCISASSPIITSIPSRTS